MRSKYNHQIIGKTAPRPLLPPNETSSARNVLHLIELLVKRALWNCQSYWMLSKIDGKALLLKKTPTQLTELREVELVLT